MAVVSAVGETAQADLTIAPFNAEPDSSQAVSTLTAPSLLIPVELDATRVRELDGAKAAQARLGRDKPATRDSHSQGNHYSLDVAVVSDYRRGGVSRSGHDPAFQIGGDVETSSGWSAGVFASTIAERKGAHAEVELYGARSFEFGDTELSIGAAAVIFPGGRNANFELLQASVSTPVGPVDATLAVNYAWEQANNDHEDGYSIHLRGRTRIGRLAGVPLTLGASVGRAEGHFAIEETKVDWSVSLTADIHRVDVGISYVDTNLEDERGDPGFVFSIAHTF